MNWMDEVLEWLGFSKKSPWQRWAGRLLQAVSLAVGAMQGARGRAVEAVETARELTGGSLETARERAGAGARAGREALAERADAISRRAAEIRARRAERREERREVARERRYRGPLHLDASRSDRLVLRGRRPVDVRLPDGGMIRYRYYHRPSRARRALLRLSGRRVWPPR